MGLSRSESFFVAVQTELDGERAATLGRTARNLELALARCAYLNIALEGEDRPERREVLTNAYRDAREASERWRWTLCVQREAIGLHEHSWVDRIYPAPALR